MTQHSGGMNIGVQYPLETPTDAGAVAELTAKHLQAFTRQGKDDEVPVLVVHDEETTVEISHEFGIQHPELAVLGFRRLAAAALAHAQLLEQRQARSRGYS